MSISRRLRSITRSWRKNTPASQTSHLPVPSLHTISTKENEQLQFSFGDCPVMLVASTKPNAGKSTFALNLAVHLANTGSFPRVLLIEGDLAEADFARRLGLPKSPNFSELVTHLDEDGELEDLGDMHDFVFSRIDFPELHMLVAPHDPEFVDNIEKQEVDLILDKFKNIYDLIVIDASNLHYGGAHGSWVDNADNIILLAQDNDQSRTNKYEKALTTPKAQITVLEKQDYWYDQKKIDDMQRKQQIGVLTDKKYAFLVETLAARI